MTPTFVDQVSSLLDVVRSAVPGAAVACTYVRGEAEGTMTVGVRLEKGDIGLDGYVRTMPQDREVQAFAEWAGRAETTPMGDGVRRLPGGGLLFLFPNDRKLRQLGKVLDPQLLDRALGWMAADGATRVRKRRSRIEILRYKPERRLVARISLAYVDETSGSRWRRSGILRTFADDRGRRLHDWLGRLRREAVGCYLPEPLAEALRGRVYVEQEVEGIELARRLGTGAVDTDAITDLLNALRTSRAGPDAEVQRPVDRAIAAQRALVQIEQADGRLAPLTRAVGRRIDASLPPSSRRSVLVHGDLHLHQLLLGASGALWLVDFERGGVGHPAQDAAWLATHAELHGQSVEADRLAEACRAQAETHGGARAFDFFRLCAIVDHALLPLRRRASDWSASVERELERTLAGDAESPAVSSSSPRRSFFAVEDGGDWDVFRPRPSGPWPGQLRSTDGATTLGYYDPQTASFQPVEPRRDRALPGLREWSDRGEIVAYRPGRRAVVRLPDGGGFAKIVRPSRIGDLVSRHELAEVVGESVPGVRLPRLRGIDRAAGVLRFDALAGDPLHTVLGSEGAANAVERVGAALADWQRVRIPEGAVRSSSWPLSTWRDFVAPHDPALTELVDAVLEVLPPSVSEQDVFVHGDLHDRNILVDGSDIGFLDVDGVGAGDVAEDVSNLLAHIVLRDVQGRLGPNSQDGLCEVLMSAYRANGGRASDDAVRVGMARTLVRLACLYRFRRRWAALPRRLLRAAARRLR